MSETECSSAVRKAKAEVHFSQCVARWDRADKECREAYLQWQKAKSFREHAAIVKRTAYYQLEKERGALPNSVAEPAS